MVYLAGGTLRANRSSGPVSVPPDSTIDFCRTSALLRFLASELTCFWPAVERRSL